MTDSPTSDLSVLRATMREKAEAATPGQWIGEHQGVNLANGLNVAFCRTNFLVDADGCVSICLPEAEANAAHIAASCPQNILAVLAHDDAEIARLTERAEAAEVLAAELEQALREFTRLYEENTALRAARLRSPKPNATPDGSDTGEARDDA